MFDDYQTFARQVAPVEACFRYERQRAARQRKGAETETEQLPGFESMPYYRTSIDRLVRVKRSLSSLCVAIQETRELIVFDHIFSPKEYLRESFANHFRVQIRRFSMQNANQIESPSVLLDAIQRWMLVLQRVSWHLDMDLGTIFRQVLLEEVFDRTVEPTGQPIVSVSFSNLTNSSISGITEWFRQFIQGYSTVCYSRFLQGYVNHQSLLTIAPPSFDPSKFVERRELESFVTLFGTYGVRVLDAAMLDVIVQSVLQIKEMISQNASPLRTMQTQMLNENSWFDSARSLVSFDNFVHQTIIAGNAMTVRRLLHEAQGQVCKKLVPLIHHTTHTANRLYVDNTFTSGSFQQIDSLAYDTGVLVGAADPSLRAALARMKNTREDAELWNLLPMAFAASFTTATWRDGDYIISIEGHKNNSNVIATCIESLIVTFLAVSTDIDQQEKSIEQLFKGFVEVASMTLLRMRLRPEFARYPVRAMYIFLESFVNNSTLVSRSTLESFLPYPLVHSAYQDVSLGKQHESDRRHGAQDLVRSASVSEQETKEA